MITTSIIKTEDGEPKKKETRGRPKKRGRKKGKKNKTEYTEFIKKIKSLEKRTKKSARIERANGTLIYQNPGVNAKENESYIDSHIFIYVNPEGKIIESFDITIDGTKCVHDCFNNLLQEIELRIGDQLSLIPFSSWSKATESKGLKLHF